jgi:hypothetical protein
MNIVVAMKQIPDLQQIRLRKLTLSLRQFGFFTALERKLQIP